MATLLGDSSPIQNSTIPPPWIEFLKIAQLTETQMNQ